MSTSQRPQGQLMRTLALGAATILVVSSVIGSGVYKKVAPMTAALESPALVLLAWVLAGVVSLFGALVMPKLPECLPNREVNMLTLSEFMENSWLLCMDGASLL